MAKFILMALSSSQQNLSSPSFAKLQSKETWAETSSPNCGSPAIVWKNKTKYKQQISKKESLTVKHKVMILNRRWWKSRKKLRNKTSRCGWWMLMVGINFVKTESNGPVPNLSTRTEMSTGTTRVYASQNVKGTFIITKNQGVKLAKGSKECS